MGTIHRAGITVLAIDAESETLSQLARVLEAAGYACLQAACAQSASEMIEQKAPDLIVCDVNVSGHSGLVLCDRLRRQAGLDEVPLMFLSATQTPDIIRRSHAAGGTYYLRKPFDPKVLIELVENALCVPHLT